MVIGLSKEKIYKPSAMGKYEDLCGAKNVRCNIKFMYDILKIGKFLCIS